VKKWLIETGLFPVCTEGMNVDDVMRRPRDQNAELYRFIRSREFGQEIRLSAEDAKARGSIFSLVHEALIKFWHTAGCILTPHKDVFVEMKPGCKEPAESLNSWIYRIDPAERDKFLERAIESYYVQIHSTGSKTKTREEIAVLYQKHKIAEKANEIFYWVEDQEELIHTTYTVEIAQRIQHLDQGVAMAVLTGQDTDGFFSGNSKAAVADVSAETLLPEWDPPTTTSCGGRKTGGDNTDLIDLSSDVYESVTFGKIILFIRIVNALSYLFYRAC
jgi:hypothetical protein